MLHAEVFDPYSLKGNNENKFTENFSRIPEFRILLSLVSGVTESVRILRVPA